jgi:hypothetical protein
MNAMCGKMHGHDAKSTCPLKMWSFSQQMSCWKHSRIWW